MAFLIGECGKSITQAGFTTAAEIYCLADAKRKERQERWEIARWQSFLAMRQNPYIKPANKPATPQQWIRFAWEDEDMARKAADYTISKAQIDLLELIRQDYYNGQDRRDMGQVKS